MTLTKRDIVTGICKETGLDYDIIHNVVQQALDRIAGTLVNGDRVELRNFGVFEVRTKRARVGRNPKKPKIVVPIPARSVVRFRTGLALKNQVLQLKAGKKR